MLHGNKLESWFLSLFLWGYANCSPNQNLSAIPHSLGTEKNAGPFLKSVPTINKKFSKYSEQNLPLHNFLKHVIPTAVWRSASSIFANCYMWKDWNSTADDDCNDRKVKANILYAPINMKTLCISGISFPTTPKLTLKQYGFELCRSTYMWGFFNSKYYSTAWSMVGWICICGAADSGEPWIQGTKCALHVDFQLHWRVSAPNPQVVQGSTL